MWWSITAPSFTNSEGKTNSVQPDLTDYRQLSGSTSETASTESDYNQHRAGLGYNYTVGQFNLVAGINYQHASLTGDQIFYKKVITEKEFENALPSLVKFKKGAHNEL